MKYMVYWTIAPGRHESAAKGFMEGGAPMPDGLTKLGRWFQPGAHKGWLLCEGSPGALNDHLTHWGSMLEFKVAPVVEDEAMGASIAKVYG